MVWYLPYCNLETAAKVAATGGEVSVLAVWLADAEWSWVVVELPDAGTGVAVVSEASVIEAANAQRMAIGRYLLLDSRKEESKRKKNRKGKVV